MSDPSNPSPPPAHEQTAKLTAADIVRGQDEIAATLRRIEAGLARLEAQNADSARRLNEQAASPAPVATTGAIADDADLDGQWGDPVVRKDPSRWQGTSYVGSTYSQCPPDYLEMLAGLLEWQAGKSDEKNEMLNNGKPRSMYLRKDAARARGHAKRILAKPQRGVAAKKPNVPTEDEMPDSVPF